jgi:hypothetical protein
MPLWSVGLAGAIVVAAAGQAVGPILSGSVTGDIGATVSQSITVDTEGLPLNQRIESVAPGNTDDFVATSDDEGTHFTVAYENNVGDMAVIRIHLLNRSEADAAAKLVLDIPANVDVELSSDDAQVEEAQLSRNTWLLTVASDTGNSLGETDGYIDIAIEPKDDSKPGFYTISGRLTHI